jgi:signal peptidase II
MVRPAARSRILLVLSVAAAVLALDAISKNLVVARLSGHAPYRALGGAVYLTLARNTGAAFSVGTGATVIFTVVALFVVGLIVRLSSRLHSIPWAIALGLMLGGAAGNLADRIFRSPGVLRGAVVDWISLFDPNGGVWPIFNLADAGIVCGGVLAVLLALLGYDISGGRFARSQAARQSAEEGSTEAASDAEAASEPTEDTDDPEAGRTPRTGRDG